MCGCAYHLGPGNLETMGRELLEASVPGLDPSAQASPQSNARATAFPPPGKASQVGSAPLGRLGSCIGGPPGPPSPRARSPASTAGDITRAEGPSCLLASNPLHGLALHHPNTAASSLVCLPPPSPPSEKPLLDPFSGQKDGA